LAQLDAYAGEQLSVPERVIVAPSTGEFQPFSPDGGELAPGPVLRGQPIGFLELLGESRPVHSPFGGRLMGLLAHPGERVREGQPLAWLRVS
jgi:biotin carboxyl carrier protein